MFKKSSSTTEKDKETWEKNFWTWCSFKHH